MTKTNNRLLTVS